MDIMTKKRRRHTPEQIIRKLAEGNRLLAEDTGLDEVCRHLEVAESTWHRWLTQYGGMKANCLQIPATSNLRRSPVSATYSNSGRVEPRPPHISTSVEPRCIRPPTPASARPFG